MNRRAEPPAGRALPASVAGGGADAPKAKQHTLSRLAYRGKGSGNHREARKPNTGQTQQPAPAGAIRWAPRTPMWTGRCSSSSAGGGARGIIYLGRPSGHRGSCRGGPHTTPAAILLHFALACRPPALPSGRHRDPPVRPEGRPRQGKVLYNIAHTPETGGRGRPSCREREAEGGEEREGEGKESGVKDVIPERRCGTGSRVAGRGRRPSPRHPGWVSGEYGGGGRREGEEKVAVQILAAPLLTAGEAKAEARLMALGEGRCLGRGGEEIVAVGTSGCRVCRCRGALLLIGIVACGASGACEGGERLAVISE
ncbi:hypothetical protein E2C01_000091 [Portunus trituberculatus]|uniref:Uncharacterized protein n=1 Tax=Portunus trituberculatus TaxID=210409 RepID=A0A5B7CDD9_PORTR|nr:hypothetical protein [Portunus trituberculatus]